MPKRVFFDDEARAKVLAGAKKIYEPVRSTMGPLGRNVIIQNQFQLPVPTHDGVTVARSIDLPHKDDETLGESVGADLLRLAASKVNDQVGDGTTTVTVLSYHILNEANKLIAAGHNPMILKRQLDRAAEKIMELLPSYIEALKGDKDKIRQVANISAGGDEFLGNLIADVMESVGEDGDVTVEQSQGVKVTSELVEGYSFDRGLVSPYMINDAAKMRAIVEGAPILITDGKISNVRDILPVLELVSTSTKQKQIIIICDDMDSDALQTLTLNHVKGIFHTYAIKAPAFGDRRKEMLEDLATLTGALVISREKGMEFSDVTIEMLGAARRVIVDRENTIIVQGKGDPEAITERMSSIRDQIATADSDYNKEKLEERLAALAGKVAIIKVGGVSETEIEEKKFRVDDAVFATKAAMAEGIVAGGGVTLLNMVYEFLASDAATGEPGEALLLRALTEPFNQLMLNSGNDASYMQAEIRRSEKKGWGYSVYEPDKLIDLKKAGIIDPAKVTRETIQNAVSIAGTAITMGSIVIDIPVESAPLPRQ